MVLIPRREQPDTDEPSIYERFKDYLEEAYGRFKNEGKTWEDIDLVRLVGYLYQRLPFAISEGPCLHRLLWRSPKAINTVIWKLPVGYNKPDGFAAGRNASVFFANRQGKKFNLVDKAFAEAYLSDEARKEYLTNPFAYGAYLQGRTEQEVLEWLECLAERQQEKIRGFDFNNETRLEKIARRAFEAVKGSQVRLKRSLGPIRISRARIEELRVQGIYMPAELVWRQDQRHTAKPHTAELPAADTFFIVEEDFHLEERPKTQLRRET